MVNASGISAFMDGTFLHGPTSHYALHCQPQMQSYRLLWMFFLGILLLIFGLALLIGCGRAAFRKQQPISE